MNHDSGSMAIIPSADNVFEIREGKHAVLMAQRNAKLRTVPFVGAVLKARRKNTVIVTLIIPVDNGDVARIIAKSLKQKTDRNGSLIVTFVKDGETVSAAFAKDDQGLILE